MTHRPRLTLIHATRVAIDPIESAAAALWPEAETVTILEEGLSKDRSGTEQLTSELCDRILGLVHYAELAQSDAVLFTCSAFGSAIERASKSSQVPVMKPNEAMFDAAFKYGSKAALIYTFEPAAKGMQQEFREAAVTMGSSAELSLHYCKNARAAKTAGDEETHDRLVAETVMTIRDCDVILLAQFSMASAAPLARTKTPVPILTSPEAAITEMRRRIEAVEGPRPC